MWNIQTNKKPVFHVKHWFSLCVKTAIQNFCNSIFFWFGGVDTGNVNIVRLRIAGAVTNFRLIIASVPDSMPIIFRHNRNWPLNDKIGYCVYAHPATIIHEDSIIYTSGNIPDVRYKYRFGDMTFDKLSKLIWGKMYNRNLFFFSDNSTGALVESYVSLCKKLIKK